jgi:serine/threonine protein kinase
MDTIDKYQILRKLGEGATAVVYLGYDSFASREVAIKVFSKDLFKRGERGRLARKLFVTEASLAGKLDHPHIVQIYDASAQGDPSYLVMEYVPGGTLEPYCEPDNLMHVVETLELMFKCSRALEYAARQGVIHRDLKPANILRGEGTNVKVSDFGAALMATADTTQVANVGSPAYMSPEQVQEQPLTQQSDIFSLGVVMYQLLTGSQPFHGGNNFAMIYQITHVHPPQPSVLRPEVPASVDAVVMKALHKSCEARYRTWDEFSFDLAEALRSQYAPLQSNVIADAEKFNTLRGLSFFRDFDDVQIWEVVRLSQWSRVGSGEPLIREGESGDFFCVLASGDVKVTRQGKLLNVLSAGECVGEMAYLTPGSAVRGATVTALREATVITLPTNAFAHASEVCRASFDRAFLRILVERLSLANVRLSSV